MEPPKQITPTTLGDYLEVMTKAVFQSGMSWAVIERKWPGFREAFAGFDPAAVANLTPDELDRLAADSRIVRNRRKIEATIENARAMLDIEREHGGFVRYLASHRGFEATVRDLRRRFKFMGEFGCFYFLYVVGQPVPTYEEWCRAHGREPAHLG